MGGWRSSESLAHKARTSRVANQTHTSPVVAQRPDEIGYAPRTAQPFRNNTRDVIEGGQRPLLDDRTLHGPRARTGGTPPGP